MDEWLNRADISTYLTPKQLSQNNKASKDFKVEYTKDQQLLNYNGLRDKYLKSYFQGGLVKNHLIKIGLILPDGSPKDKIFDFKPHWINQFDEEKAKIKKEADKQIRNRKNNCRSSLGDHKGYQDESELYKLPPLQYQIRSQTPKIERPIINKKHAQKAQLRLNTDEDQGLTANQQQQISPQESQNGRIKYFKAENSNLEGLNHLKQRQSHLKQYLQKSTFRVNQSYDGATYAYAARNSQKNLHNQQKEKSIEIDNQMINLKLNPKYQQQHPHQGNFIQSNNATPIKAQQINFDQENSTQQNIIFYNQNAKQNVYNSTSYNQSPIYQQNQQIIIPNNRYSNKKISKNKNKQINHNQNQEIKDLIQQNDTTQIKGNIKQILSSKNRENQKQFNFDQPNFPQSTRQKNFQTDFSQNRQNIRNSKDQSQNSEMIPAILSKYQPSPANKQITTKLHAQHMQDMQQKFKTQPNSITQSPPSNQQGISTGDESDSSHPSKQCVQFIIQQINTIEYTPQNQSKDKIQSSKNQQLPIFLVDEVKKDDSTKFKEYQIQSNISQNSLSPYRQSNQEALNSNKISNHMNVMQMQHMQKQQLQQESSKDILQQSDALQKMILMQQNKGQQRSVITQKLVLPQSISVDVSEEALKQQKLSSQYQNCTNKINNN
ncbi:hypothetical protein TTHERM_00925550 (macronuclear) [Tetrahymena thermophila SB210]|uniref:Uncharacterized protein n=1 Tax=Tetrahymena thermophila (strain SB210) TaxID=312017 RepID=Q22E04_TETTS|nr:hypothetical protein TTHERM_00925550 [Tetrahymena thermophila SB210]EAR83508.2 hypothetical protein TTHERM_00925550 [Tetrahymena thermophila SB210]|eukprot:XP_001031171.2 hypothetical protein TTHERM_00925550 [Tetrahymena thermophila SB210]